MWRCLFWTIILSYFVESQSRLLPPPSSNEDFFTDILNKVLQTSRAKDVLLILRDSLLDGQINGVLDKIVATTTQRVSTLYVNADRMEPEFRVSSLAMSRDLVVYIYVSGRGPDVVEGELVAKDIRRFIHYRVRPKVLVLMILPRPCHNLAMLFRAMWSKMILDVIVVEYSKSEYSGKWSTIVHRYNPFNDSHTQEPYSADVKWFTDKFPNMQGYPLKYAFTPRPPYSNIISTSKGLELKGVDHLLNEVLIDKMNFTSICKIISKPVYFHKMRNGSYFGIVIDILSGKYDALLVTMPMWGHLDNDDPFPLQFTTPFRTENWCFVVPKLLAKWNFMAHTVIRLLVMSFLIVGIFWLCSKFMKFNPDRWHSLRIFGIILATSFPPTPTKLHERIIFFSIIVISFSYSSRLFAELTSVGFKSDRYVQFDHLQDLTNSDLVLMMHENVWNVIKQFHDTFEYNIRKSGKTILEIPSTEICLRKLLMHQNVSCFMDETWTKLIAINHKQKGKSVIKMTKLCYLQPPVGYGFLGGSPYVKRVSDLFLMLSSAGIRDKWQRDYMRNETREPPPFEIKHHTKFKYVNVFYPTIYVLIAGYFTSALVFIVELIWKRFDINLNLCSFQ